MTAVGLVVSRFFDLLAAPAGGSAMWALVLISVFTAVWALLVFKTFTPQQKLLVARDRLLGRIYEMGLYQDHLRVLARIQRDLARDNLRYLGLTSPALLVLVPLMALTWIQLESRLVHRPLRPGEETVFAVTLTPEAAGRLDDLGLELPDGIAVAAGPVRDRTGAAAAWRLSIAVAGDHVVKVRMDDEVVGERTVNSRPGLPRLNETSGAGFWAGLLYPGAPVLDAGGPLRETTVRFPGRRIVFLGLEMDWWVPFLVISMLAGLALKDVLRVSF